jgi:hypothetical protein
VVSKNPLNKVLEKESFLREILDFSLITLMGKIKKPSRDIGSSILWIKIAMGNCGTCKF